MARFLLFVLLFATQLIAGFSTRLPPSQNGETITVLSIDGGAIKGIIPAVILDHLDKALKKKDPSKPLAHYFDVIAGTSTGGLITAMLASPSPNDPQNPVFTPAKIVDFYKNFGPSIFNTTGSGDGVFDPRPMFDGEFLHNITAEILKDTRLSDTLTNVVIPTFDLKKQQPVIFSNYKLKKVPYLDAKMSDICIATSAAPIALPPYFFENDGVEFNMIDGGVAAGNPTEAAISEVMQHNDYTKILLLSLGTGVTRLNESYNVEDATTWNGLRWSLILAKELGPRASTYMTEYYLSTVFSRLQPTTNYLRVQEYDLDPSMSKDINVTKENLDNLEKEGKELLQKNVVRINLDTFDFEETNEGTYAEALDRLADKLYEEKKLREKRRSKEKRGRQFIEAIRMPFGRIPAA